MRILYRHLSLTFVVVFFMNIVDNYPHTCIQWDNSVDTSSGWISPL